MREFLDLARRAVSVLERIALRLELLSLPQYNYTTQTIDLAAEGLNPNAVTPRQRLDVTMNSAEPIWVQATVREADGQRWLVMWLFDGYSSVIYQANLRARSLKELRDSGRAF